VSGINDGDLDLDDYDISDDAKEQIQGLADGIETMYSTWNEMTGH